MVIVTGLVAVPVLPLLALPQPASSSATAVAAAIFHRLTAISFLRWIALMSAPRLVLRTSADPGRVPLGGNPGRILPAPAARGWHRARASPAGASAATGRWRPAGWPAPARRPQGPVCRPAHRPRSGRRP